MIYRSKEKDLKAWIGTHKYLVIKGARQTGKTSILKKLFEEDQRRKAYILCDNFDNQTLFTSPKDLILYLSIQYDFDANEPFVLFLDEFQSIAQIGMFLKNLFDTYPHLQIIASGSSSLEITKNTESLAGRVLEFELFSLSLFEIIAHYEPKLAKKIPLRDFDMLTSYYRLFQSTLERYLWEYITFGGYPEIVTTESAEQKHQLLKSYHNTYIEKDIIGLLRIENIQAFRNLIRILAANIGQLINVNELSNTLNISYRTTLKYINILEETFVIQRLAPFSKNIRSEVSKMHKVYFTDIGLRNIYTQSYDLIDYQHLIGPEIENIIHLILQEIFHHHELYFYRTTSKAEIDFVISNPQSQISHLIEVKYRNQVKSHAASLHFQEKYGNDSLQKIIITKNQLEMTSEFLYIPVSLLSFIDFQV